MNIKSNLQELEDEFLLIANNDYDGVGQTAVNLSKNLIDKGHKSDLIVLHKFSNKKYVTKFRSFIARILLFILNFIKKSYSELFGFGYSTVHFLNWKIFK